jgi:hypothetical protein
MTRLTMRSATGIVQAPVCPLDSDGVPTLLAHAFMPNDDTVRWHATQ